MFNKLSKSAEIGQINRYISTKSRQNQTYKQKQTLYLKFK